MNPNEAGLKSDASRSQANPVLPWFTPFVTALAGVASSFLVCVIAAPSADPGWWHARVLGKTALSAVWAGGTFGFGLAIADRLRRGRSRARSWPVGAALAALAPSPLTARFVAHHLWADHMYLGRLSIAALSALLALALGLAARLERGALWRLPLVGATCEGAVALLGLLVAVVVLAASPSPGHMSLLPPGPILRAFVSTLLHGGLLGLAVACALAAGRRPPVA
jgi:hypothetical protein